MDISYLLGIGFALSSGTLNAFASIIQKKCLKKLPTECTDDKILSNVARQPMWIFSLVLSMGFGTICNMMAQNYIGPSLTPGLQAMGLIVLAIGSVKINGERLKPIEILGIILMIGGILSLGFCQLDIPSSEVNVQEMFLIYRFIIYTICLTFLWISTYGYAKRKKFVNHHEYGLILAISAGFLFCLSNFWISPLMATIGKIFGGIAQPIETVFFIIASFMLPFSNFMGIRQTQIALKYADASKAQPIQSIPTQISPIIIYYLVFMKSALVISSILMIVGVALIILAGFFLGKRKADLK